MAEPRRLRAVPDARHTGAPGGGPGAGPGGGPATAESLLTAVGRGDSGAFAALYDLVAAPVHGLTRRVVRDRAQAEEVTQEVLVEVWRTAPRFDAERGGAMSWVLTLAHRRAVDRVRSAAASSARENKLAQRETTRPYDDVAEAVELRLEHEQVRRCLERLTEVQREAVTMAYYGGHTHREVAALLGSPLGTVKTRLRDALIRLRDCMGVTA